MAEEVWFDRLDAVALSKPGYSEWIIQQPSLDGQLHRFMCLHRKEPFWQRPCIGSQLCDVPAETQFFSAQLISGCFVVIVPLIFQEVRCSIRGASDSTLRLVAETGDPNVAIPTRIRALVCVTGNDLYAAIAHAAHKVRDILQAFKPQQRPVFMQGLGWCTWDAFYKQVSQDKICQGLETLSSTKGGDVRPYFVIIDDGWQQVDLDKRTLTGFGADASKFSNWTLTETVAMMKASFGVKCVLAWHTVDGYWCGVDSIAFQKYTPQWHERHWGSTIQDFAVSWLGSMASVVPPKHIESFYNDFHTSLAATGLDGVKIDNQASLEALAFGLGCGRVGMAKAYRAAALASVQAHFGADANVINCMSCSNELLYLPSIGCTRTSSDFCPHLPDSHGMHIFANATASLWFGEFVHPDWDMWQSGHESGYLHAVARVIGGSPVYVSDIPGHHNKTLLHKVALPDGHVFLPDSYGQPTQDCVFANPTTEPILYKIFNTARTGCVGLLAVFNLHSPGGPVLKGKVASHDLPLPALSGININAIKGFVLFAHFRNDLRYEHFDQWSLELEPGHCEMFTIVPLLKSQPDFAVIGLANLFNSAGTVLDEEIIYEDNALFKANIKLAHWGPLVCWSCRRVSLATVSSDNSTQVLSFEYDETSGRLDIIIPEMIGILLVQIKF